VNTFTAQDLEARLLDYVYDELEPEERAAFEAALPGAPEVAAELAAMRETRAAMSDLHTPGLPAGFEASLASVFAEADAAAAGFRDAAAQPPEPVAAPASPRPAPLAEPGFWARLGQKIAAALATPAFATAAVALIVTGVAVTMAKKGDLPGEDRSATSQEIGAVAPVAVAAGESPTGGGASVPDEKGEESEGAGVVASADAPPPEPEVAEEKGRSRAGAGDGAERGGLLDGLAAEGAPSTARAEMPALDKKAEAPAKRIASKVDTLAAGRAQGAKEATTLSLDGDAAFDGKVDDALAQKATNAMEPPTGEAASSFGNAERRANSYAYTDAPPAPAEPAAPAREDRAFAPAPADEVADAGLSEAPARPAPALAKPTSAPKTTSTSSVPAGQPSAPPAERDMAKDDAEAEESNAELTARRIDGLWATLRRQLDAGDLDAADRTLTELARLGADAARVKAAKAEVADARARAEASKAASKKAPRKAQEMDAQPATRNAK
jgi:anti-sigma factor RsiW